MHRGRRPTEAVGWTVMLRGRYEFECCTVDAIAEACRFRAVFKDMSLMAFATGAVNLGSRENELKICIRLDNLRIDGLPKAGPAGAAVEFMLG